VALLGVQQLDKLNEIGRHTAEVNKILVHSTWNPQVQIHKGDIAVLILEQDVAFSIYIQPVCLPKIGVKMKDLKDGVVVGFGKSESSVSHANVPSKASIPIQDLGYCLLNDPTLAAIFDYKTFCGGYANGTGACTGGSGGGLTVVSNGRHFLRGIVSASLYDQEYGCDFNSYAIFTDMRFYISYVRDAK